MEQKALLWFEYAEVDLETAIMASKQYPPRLWSGIVCYHCQQAVEKYLKGYLIGIGEKPQKTHDLQLLRGMCERRNPYFGHPDLLNVCEYLTQFGVPARYPDEIEILDTDIPRALKAAKTVEQFEPIQKAFAELREVVEAEETDEDDLEP